MYISTFLKAVACAVLIASSCKAESPSNSLCRLLPFNKSKETSQQFGEVSQSYNNITTKEGVIAYLEQALDVNNTEGMHKTIFIERLTGQNDLGTSGNSVLQSLLQNTPHDTTQTVALKDVALYLDNGKVTIVFKVADKANTAVKVEYNLHDQQTNSFKSGLSTLKTISQHEFAALQRSMQRLKKSSSHKVRDQWNRLKNGAHKYFTKAKQSFNHLVHRRT